MTKLKDEKELMIKTHSDKITAQENLLKKQSETSTKKIDELTLNHTEEISKMN